MMILMVKRLIMVMELHVLVMMIIDDDDDDNGND